MSLNDFIIKGWAAALTRVPAANAIWAGDRILRFRQADIGVAVSIDGGLITPVIRNAESKTVTGISQEMKDLAERARSKKLKPAEYSGGSSSISNLGMFGVQEFAAIVTAASPKGIYARVLNPPVEGRIVRGGRGLDVGDTVKISRAALGSFSLTTPRRRVAKVTRIR